MLQNKNITKNTCKKHHEKGLKHGASSHKRLNMLQNLCMKEAVEGCGKVTP